MKEDHLVFLYYSPLYSAAAQINMLDVGTYSTYFLWIFQ